MWVLDHLQDLESDFSAIHRVEDIYLLDGPQFFSKAERLFAYQSVMRARVEAEQTPDARGTGKPDRQVKTLREVQSFAPGAGTRVVVS